MEQLPSVVGFDVEPIPGTLIIGLGHRARHGKDTFAKDVMVATKGEAQRFAFADDLYAVCRVQFGMTVKDGRLLQIVGTEVYRQGKTVEYKGQTLSSGRGPDPDVWTRSVYSKLQDAKPSIALVSDVRFPNEADLIKKMGGVMVRCKRWNPTEVDRVWTPFVDPGRDPNHPSEVALENYPWDFTIDNYSGQLDRFLGDVRTTFARIRMMHDAGYRW